MGAVIGRTFAEFMQAVGENFGAGSEKILKENEENLKSVFDVAAKNDGGDDDALLEEDSQGFLNLVQEAVANILKEKAVNKLKSFFSKINDIDSKQESKGSVFDVKKAEAGHSGFVNVKVQDGDTIDFHKK